MTSAGDALNYIRARMQPIVPKAHEMRIEDAVTDARVLLKFCIESHRKIPAKVIDDLVAAIDSVWPSGKQTPVVGGERERKFWNAYEALSELAAPVTARSVLQSRWQSKGWVSVTLPYAVVALLLFAFIVLLQWHWFDGSTLRSGLKEHEERIKKLDGDYSAKSIQNKAASVLVDKRTRELLEQGCPHPFGLGPGERKPALSEAKRDTCEKLAQAREEALTALNAPQLDVRATWDELARTRSILESKFELLEEWMGRWPFDYRVGEDEKIAVRTAEAGLKSDRENLEKARLQRDQLRDRLQSSRAAAPVQEGTAQRTRAEPEPSEESLKLRTDLNTAETSVRNLEIAFNAQQRKVSQEADNRIERLRHRVTQRLDLLERYVFPTLLGALGSLIFILRTLITAIRDHVYTSHFLSLSIVRVSLGTMAGLLGTLIFPREALPVKDILPLAIPLLLGYAVEIFFTAMDRIVKAFTETPK